MELTCPFCKISRNSQDATRTLRRWGSYFRKSDGQSLTRIWCSPCRKTFSAATTSQKRGQKKRQLNAKVKALLNGGVSQREAARILKVNRKTVIRKFRFAILTAKDELTLSNQNHTPCAEVEFDDLETFEHTKCKPVSVIMMVEAKTRRILGFEVAQMPAKGPLARLSRAKYGPRCDHRPAARQKLFGEMQPFIDPRATFRSDSSPHYTADVRSFFPSVKHDTVMSRKAAVTGQGELKKIGFDPIFSINHSFAMLRAHINRLFRRTWCTTKRIDQLAGHIAIYALEHNRRLATG